MLLEWRDRQFLLFYFLPGIIADCFSMDFYVMNICFYNIVFDNKPRMFLQ